MSQMISCLFYKCLRSNQLILMFNNAFTNIQHKVKRLKYEFKIWKDLQRKLKKQNSIVYWKR